MFYTPRMRVEYREEPCRSALNRVRGMPFGWSLNPYMGCVHRCTFCYVRAFELRADRPADDRYGRSIRVKTNVAEVLAAELARDNWMIRLFARNVTDRRAYIGGGLVVDADNVPQSIDVNALQPRTVGISLDVGF